MKPPLLNFEIFWKDLDQKTPEKRPKTRSKFVKSTNSCHLEFSSSFWLCCFFPLLTLYFDFFFKTKTQTNLITPGKPGFQTVFLFFKWVLFERIFILISRFEICDFTNFFWPLWPSYFDFSFFSAMHHTVATDCCTQYYSLQASVFWRNNSVCLKWKIQIFKSFWL